MSARRLHVLVVNAAVGVDVVAEVARIGDLAQVSLDFGDIAVTDEPVAAHIADQEASAGLGGGEGVTRSVVHVSESNDDVLLVAGLAVERRQEGVRIIWINTHAADCSAARACAVGSGHLVVEGEANRKAFPVTAIFYGRERDIERVVPVRLSGERTLQGKFPAPVA